MDREKAAEKEERDESSKEGGTRGKSNKGEIRDKRRKGETRGGTILQCESDETIQNGQFNSRYTLKQLKKALAVKKFMGSVQMRHLGIRRK